MFAETSETAYAGCFGNCDSEQNVRGEETIWQSQ